MFDERRLVERRRKQTDIKLSLLEEEYKIVGNNFSDIDFEARILPREGFQKERNQIGSDGRDDTKVQFTGDFASELCRISPEFRNIGKDPFCPIDDFPAVSRGSNGVSCPVEDYYAKFFLKFLDHHAQGRLCHEAFCGGCCKMPVCIHRRDVFELLEIHNIDCVY